MAWHPVAPNTVAVGSKGGDVILWNFEQDVQKPRVFFDGIGPGGSIQQLVFDKRNNGRSIFSVSIDGTLSLRDLESGGEESRFLATGTSYIIDSVVCRRWYTSLDVSFPGRAMLAGNNKGFVNLLTVDGELQWEKRLHKQKVKHIEFSPNESWCFVTASVDREMKVWDIRKIKDETSCLFSDTHERGINAAHFSRTDGGSILTTDQNCQLRIYSCPSFSLSHSIHHPHRHFQHLTPIVATWHPLSDVVVVGRYPEGIGHASDDLRTVDFFDGRTGHILHHQFDIQAGKKILSLNLFNHTGDQLMSAASELVFVGVLTGC
ncbi:UNVERIFIED_CONTAM: hypothetical protein GTU68_010412 [Idotea baltica]|nr:hypothetical protein [Idotea baltica]